MIKLATMFVLLICTMAQISELTYEMQGTARSYIDTWSRASLTSDGLVLYAGGISSGLIYNLYADKLLQLNLVDESVRNRQSFR